MTEHSDEDLMVQAAQGNEVAFRELAARHDSYLLRLAHRLVGDRGEAEDIVQEALLRLWTNAPRWKPVASVRTWLYRVTVNLANDLHRRRGRRRPDAPLTDAADAPDPAPDPVETLDRDRTGRQVADAIAALPERQRNALVLTYYEGLSNGETAGILGTSVGSVEALLVRARRTLREALAPLKDNRE